MTDNEMLTEAVETGADWLDTVMPGWADEIDVDRLDMQLCSRCVLGQLNSGPARYRRPDPIKNRGYDPELGFDLPDEMFGAHLNADLVRQQGWSALLDLWLSQIARRT